jgi:hypothetical protein
MLHPDSYLNHIASPPHWSLLFIVRKNFTEIAAEFAVDRRPKAAARQTNDLKPDADSIAPSIRMKRFLQLLPPLAR